MSSDPERPESPALAAAKQIGEDVEDLVIDAVDELAHADEDDAHHDAETVALLTPSSDDVLQLGSIPLVERGTDVEIKAARDRTNGVGSPRGRWFFKGRDDGQHAALLDENAVYLLTVYGEDVDSEREVLAAIVVPATIVDELLRDRWYDSGRVEGAVAKLTWTAVLDVEVVENTDPDAGGGSA